MHTSGTVGTLYDIDTSFLKGVQMKRFYVVLLLLVLLTGCSNKSNDNETIMDIEDATDDNIVRLEEDIDELNSILSDDYIGIEHNNPFDMYNIKVLDSVADVILVDKYEGVLSNGEHVVKEMSFKGAILASGTYYHYDEDEFFGKHIEFQPDDDSASLFPKANDDQRTLWMFLYDYEQIVDDFGEPGDYGEVTLVLDNYFITREATETGNSASVIAILKTEYIGKINDLYE